MSIEELTEAEENQVKSRAAEYRKELERKLMGNMSTAAYSYCLEAARRDIVSAKSARRDLDIAAAKAVDDAWERNR